MATYVELRHTPFHQMMQKQLEKKSYTDWTVRGIRRPLAGITIKPNTYSYMRIIRETGEEIPLPTETGGPYAAFLMVQWDYTEKEKFNILQTLGDTDYFYPFGRTPRQYSFSGYLLNSEDFNWRAQWVEFYDKYLRASKLAKSRARIYLYVDNSLIEGYLVACHIPQNSKDLALVQFVATMLVTDHVDVDFYAMPTPNVGEYVTGPPDTKKRYEAGETSTPPVDYPRVEEVDGQEKPIHPNDRRTLWKTNRALA